MGGDKIAVSTNLIFLPQDGSPQMKSFSKQGGKKKKKGKEKKKRLGHMPVPKKRARSQGKKKRGKKEGGKRSGRSLAKKPSILQPDSGQKAGQKAKKRGEKGRGKKVRDGARQNPGSEWLGQKRKKRNKNEKKEGKTPPFFYLKHLQKRKRGKEKGGGKKRPNFQPPLPLQDLIKKKGEKKGGTAQSVPIRGRPFVSNQKRGGEVETLY